MLHEDRLAKLPSLTLDRNSHTDFEKGHCAMELVAWLAGEEHSYRPQCACPVITSFVVKINDRILDNKMRAKALRDVLPRIVGTRSTRAVEVRRAYMAVDFACRVAAPMALEARAFSKPELAQHAATLRALPEIVDRATAQNAEKVARGAADAATAYTADAATAYTAYAAYAATDAAATAAYAYDAADAAYDAADAAYDAADADADAGFKVYRLVAELIVRMCDVREEES